MFKRLFSMLRNLVTLPPYQATPKLKIFIGEPEQTEEPKIRIFKEQ